jgi:hypothetical protein
MIATNIITMERVLADPIYTRCAQELGLSTRPFQGLQRNAYHEGRTYGAPRPFLINVLELPEFVAMNRLPSIGIDSSSKLKSMVHELGLGFGVVVENRPDGQEYLKQLREARAKHYKKLDPLSKLAAPETNVTGERWIKLAAALCAANPMQEKYREAVFNSLLEGNHRQIFLARQKNPKPTFEQLAEVFGITGSRVHFIQNESVREIRDRICYATTRRIALGHP